MDFKYKNLIYFTICEIMLDNLVKTNYTTLTNMCVNIYMIKTYLTSWLAIE